MSEPNSFEDLVKSSFVVFGVGMVIGTLILVALEIFS
jgi:hypothetical protein